MAPVMGGRVSRGSRWRVSAAGPAGRDFTKAGIICCLPSTAVSRNNANLIKKILRKYYPNPTYHIASSIHYPRYDYQEWTDTVADAPLPGDLRSHKSPPTAVDDRRRRIEEYAAVTQRLWPLELDWFWGTCRVSRCGDAVTCWRFMDRGKQVLAGVQETLMKPSCGGPERMTG